MGKSSNQINDLLDPKSDLFKVGLIVLLILLLISIGGFCQTETYNNLQFKIKEYFGLVACLETVNVNDQNFCKIGEGPAIDRTAMFNWLGTGGILYKNHENQDLVLSGEQYRAINGFLPPSFAYFPYGINTDNYKPEDPEVSIFDPNREGYNVEEGRAMCMQACKDTNCIAVQTEVPQMCYTKRVNKAVPKDLIVDGMPDGTEFFTTKNDCKGKATHSCTLFYDNIENSDDAYYQLGKDAFNNPDIDFKCGLKYYENNSAPGITPGNDINVSPSESTVKWCKGDVSIIGLNKTKYQNVKGKSCSCIGKSECDDSNCCVYRDLITSEWARNNTPYFNLPINVTLTEEINNGNPSAICPAKDKNNQCCGLCPDGKGGYEIKSCPMNKQFLDGTLDNPLNFDTWWAVDTERSKCLWPELPWWTYITPVGWVAGLIDAYTNERRDMEECLEDYAALRDSNPKEAYRKLTSCCGYLDQACVDTIAQPFCGRSRGDVIRGCYGDPAIISLDSIQGEIGACDNSSVIPPANRCIQDTQGKKCTGFPYGCKTGPLWIMQ